MESHGVLHAKPRPRFGLHAPVYCPSGVAAFGRDIESSKQVWSANEGYPGDFNYREYYRDVGFDLPIERVREHLPHLGPRYNTGIKYFRITGRTDHKEPYVPAWARERAAEHAGNFLFNRRQQIDYLAGAMDRPPLILAPYDAELFGHWWFEGPEWLENVLRRLPRQGLRAVTPEDYLAAHPRLQQADPSPSSWGEGGYNRVWLNDSNDWILPPLHDAGRRMTALAGRFGDPTPRARRILAQAGRELLLAQASDWPFILKHGTAVDYATRRVRTHLDRFDRLARVLESRLADSRRPGSGGAPEEVAGPDDLESIEAQDNLFPDLDPGVWRTA
jgi:1,4-alpha-glucan branching enzyme